MNGLEAILKRIMSDAEDRIRDIAEQTDARCSELLATAEREAAKIINDAKTKADEQAQVLLRRSVSLSALEARKMILSSRQTLIDEVIIQAAERLAALSDDDKTALYSRLLSENAEGSESVVFAGKDAANANRILSSVNKTQNWKLTLDPAAGAFSGGMILRQDLIETNLTFDMLIRSLRPELVGLAAKVLFSE